MKIVAWGPAHSLPTAPSRRRRFVGDATPPPDAGLQVERTSLSWARTWAVLAVNITLVVKLVAETSIVVAASASAALIVPLFALARGQRWHEDRALRFLDTSDAAQPKLLAHAVLVSIINVMALTGLAAVLHRGSP